jgi:hypothetical protein
MNFDLDTILSSIKTSDDARKLQTQLSDLSQKLEQKLKNLLIDENKQNLTMMHDIDYIQFYLDQIKMIYYSDIPKQNLSLNEQERLVDAKFQIGNSNQIIQLFIHNMYKDGDEDVNATLSYLIDNTKNIIWLIEDDVVFNKNIGENLLTNSGLRQVDKRETKFCIKDMSIAILDILEDKYGEEDEYGMDYGITDQMLNKILEL